MTIAEIRKIEEDREGSLGVIHLQKEGSFYHANDWSAWLMTKYPIGEAANKPMTVTAKKAESYLGIMKHSSSYRLRRRLFMTRPILRICTFDERILKVV